MPTRTCAQSPRPFGVHRELAFGQMRVEILCRRLACAVCCILLVRLAFATQKSTKQMKTLKQKMLTGTDRAMAKHFRTKTGTASNTSPTTPEVRHGFSANEVC